MKVTVIIPVRNEAPRVDGTLESLLGQTRPPDEIVVADAASSDATVERVMRHVGRGVPIRVVSNETLFAGGGRNAATRAASHDLLVNMDVGNRAEPTWLEEMVRPFEEDASLDLLGGLYYPEWEGSFPKVVAAVFYTIDCILPTMSPDEIRPLVPPNFVPGGMCMAYRRRIWERAGGFCEWSRKGQDRLFGLRIRHVGGNVDFTMGAIVHHHMAKSFRALFDRHFFYELWAARQGLPSAQSRRILQIYAALFVAAIVAFGVGWPAWSAVLAVLLYAVARAWKKLATVSSKRRVSFGSYEKLLSIPVLLALDGALAGGRIAGALNRVLQSRWRRDTNRYLESGQS